jgi:hypothetical protein
MIIVNVLSDHIEKHISGITNLLSPLCSHIHDRVSELWVYEWRKEVVS